MTYLPHSLVRFVGFSAVLIHLSIGCGTCCADHHSERHCEDVHCEFAHQEHGPCSHEGDHHEGDRHDANHDGGCCCNFIAPAPTNNGFAPSAGDFGGSSPVLSHFDAHVLLEPTTSRALIVSASPRPRAPLYAQFEAFLL